MIDEIKLLADETSESIASLEYEFKWGTSVSIRSASDLKEAIYKVKANFADNVIAMFPEPEKVISLKNSGEPNRIELTSNDITQLVEKAREIKSAKRATA